MKWFKVILLSLWLSAALHAFTPAPAYRHGDADESLCSGSWVYSVPYGGGVLAFKKDGTWRLDWHGQANYVCDPCPFFGTWTRTPLGDVKMKYNDDMPWADVPYDRNLRRLGK